MTQAITLRMARENCMLTETVAATKAGIQLRTLRRWERDCSNAERGKFMRLLAVYKLNADHVHIGPEDELLVAQSKFTEIEISKRINRLLDTDPEYAQHFNALTASSQAFIVGMTALMLNTFDSFEDLELTIERIKLDRRLEVNVS